MKKLSFLRATKIVATTGTATDGKEIIRSLIDSRSECFSS